MSGPETGGPPSGPKTDRILAGLDAAIGLVLGSMKPITDLHAHLTRGVPMRTGTNPHPQPTQPTAPPPPRLRH